MINLNNYLAKENKTIAEHNEDLMNCMNVLTEFGYLKDDHTMQLLNKAIYYHDFGKVQQGFQDRIKSEKRKRYDPEKEIFHNLLSVYFIDRENFENDEDYFAVCFAVLNHHDYCGVCDEINSNEREYTRFLKPFEDEVKKKRIRRFNGQIQDMGEENETILVKGLLNKCDYSASGGYKIEYKNDFITKGLNNLLKRWQMKTPSSDWNALQRFCKANSDKNIIAVAQTGMGKTEAGLHWIGDNKGFFILPLKTAINAMYNRFKNDIAEEETEERVSLLYGDSLSYYINENNKNKAELDVEEYNKRGKNLTLPLTVSTPDQIFNFVFKYNGYELKLATLSYSKVVIDEIQMYSPDTLAYLISGLERIHDMGGKIAVVTATLTPFIKDKLKFLNAEYGEFTDDSIRHNMLCLDKKLNADDILERYNEGGECNKILVVCNTVKKAQWLYDELSEMIDNKDNLHIFHARFVKNDRRSLENEIMDFGKTDHIDKGIWISTSVVEASLDIDFDCLFTELYELTSLFQRMGRCNRRGAKPVSDTNCYVYSELDKVYSEIEELYNLSRKAITGWNGPVSEKDKINLINEAFTTENLKNSSYAEKFKKHYEFIKNLPLYELDKKAANFREIANKDIIPYPVYEENKLEIDELQRRLADKTLTYTEKVEIRDKIMGYTVSVSEWVLKDYKKAESKGKALKIEPVKIGEKLFMDVIECRYDERGFAPVNFDTVIREPDFL
ncbi:MAG: CRISPR-associated helicase Cas3' [Clostridiales bacterium]|nr:CRISPR-associated helicase Cas3' [Clostridiales bacterium]